MSKIYAIYAGAASAVLDGAGAPVVNGASAVLGGAAPSDRGFLRFLTDSGLASVAEADVLGGFGDLPGNVTETNAAGALVAEDTIVYANLRLNITAKDGNDVHLGLWAAEFGAGIANADYAVTESNYQAGYRVYLKKFFDGATAVPEIGQVAIPSRFVHKGAGGVADFIVWPFEGTDYDGGTTADTVTADWSAALTDDIKPVLVVVALNETDLLEDKDWRGYESGSESYVAFDVENEEGRAVKGKVLLDFTSCDIGNPAENLVSDAINRNRAGLQKMAVGRAGAAGYCSFTMTPEKWLKLMLGFFKMESSTTTAGVTRKVFKLANSREAKSFTIVKSTGEGFRNVFTGCKIASLGMEVGLDAILMANVNVVGIAEYKYDAQSAGENDEYILSSLAGYDSNNPLSFVGAEVSFNGDSGLATIFSATTVGYTGAGWDVNEWVDAEVRIVGGTGVGEKRLVVSNTADTLTVNVPWIATLDGTSEFVLSHEAKCVVEGVSISIEQVLEEIRGLSRRRNGCGTVPGDCVGMFDFTMNFRDESHFRKFLGVTHTDFPYMAEKTIVFDRVDFKFAGELDEVEQEIILTVHRMAYTVMRDSIDGKQLVKLRAQGTSTFSESHETNMTLTIVNTEAAAAYDGTVGTTTSTDDIKVLPEAVRYTPAS